MLTLFEIDLERFRSSHDALDVSCVAFVLQHKPVLAMEREASKSQKRAGRVGREREREMEKQRRW